MQDATQPAKARRQRMRYAERKLKEAQCTWRAPGAASFIGPASLPTSGMTGLAPFSRRSGRKKRQTKRNELTHAKARASSSPWGRNGCLLLRCRGLLCRPAPFHGLGDAFPALGREIPLLLLAGFAAEDAAAADFLSFAATSLAAGLLLRRRRHAAAQQGSRLLQLSYLVIDRCQNFRYSHVFPLMDSVKRSSPCAAKSKHRRSSPCSNLQYSAHGILTNSRRVIAGAARMNCLKSAGHSSLGNGLQVIDSEFWRCAGLS